MNNKLYFSRLPSNWHVDSLDCFADVIDPHPSHRAPQEVENGFPFVGIGDLDYYGNASFEKARHVGLDIIEEHEMNYDIDDYSIGYAKMGNTIGKVVSLPNRKDNRYAISPALSIINPKKEIDPFFLRCVVESYSFWKQVNGKITGSTRPSIGIQQLRKILIPIPPREVQTRIGYIWRSIFDKIKVNTKINEILLQQAGAVFDKYYYASSNQQLFTSLINVLGGGTPKTGNPDFWDGSIPFFTPKDVGAPYTFQTEKYITESGLDHCNSRLYPKNTTFVTARGTVGKVSLAGVPMAMNQSCYALASETIDPLLVYFYVLKAVVSLKHKASGAVFDAIVTRDFDIETINVLTDEDAQSAVSVIAPIMEEIHNNIEENMRLSKLRDALLPKLMSGELDVSELDI